MAGRCDTVVWSLLFGCVAGFFLTPVVNANGRVFVLELKNSSALPSFRDAERACASHQAHLASAAELQHAVSECFFSPCTRGWLHGGMVGTTVCNIVGGALKAVDVSTENATEDTAHLNSFCIKDRGVPCGDPPSFPNARLQEHTGFELGDELLFTCVPGYVMPNGHSAFSLLCDSCGEWYGLVQMCVRDETEGHVDYEDKFTDAEHHKEHEGPVEAHGEVYEEVHEEVLPEGKWGHELQDTSFGMKGKEDRQDRHGEQEMAVEHGAGGKDEDRVIDDFTGHPRWDQERSEVVRTDVPTTTEVPVSLVAQKHLFWFPSEAFQQEQHPINPIVQTNQRSSGSQSKESKEQESQESQTRQHPIHADSHELEQDGKADRDLVEPGDHDDSRRDDLDDHASEQDRDDRDDRQRPYVPAQHHDVDGRDLYESHESHHDHYDMGEHEDERIRYGTQQYEDRDHTYDERESYEGQEDVTAEVGDDRAEVSEEHHDDHDDDKEQYEDDSHLDDDHDDRDDRGDHGDHDEDHDHDDHHDDRSREDDDVHQRVSVAGDDSHNVTQREDEDKTTTDETWLDGYPVAVEETEGGDQKRLSPEDGMTGTVVRATDRPNEVEKDVPSTSLSGVYESPTADPDTAQEQQEELSPGVSSPDDPEPSDSPSHSDTLDYDTQQAAPTHSWLGDLTEHPFLDHGPAPPMPESDVLSEENTVHGLPGEAGERGEMEGEMGETICTGQDCPPSSSGQGPTVAAIIAAVCVIAMAVVIGVWCYRRQQQKSSMYEMNGKGLSQSRQGQQIEMQQKV